MNSTPAGSLTDKPTFLTQTAFGSAMRQIITQDERVGLPDDFAIRHATMSYGMPDGSSGERHSIDDWQGCDGTSKCVSAHATRR